MANGINGSSSIDQIRENWVKYGGDAVANITEEDGLFILEEEDGDVFTRIGGQWIQAGNTAGAQTPEQRKQMLEEQKKANEAKMQKLDERIQAMAEEVREDVAKAMEEMEQITQEQLKATENLTTELLKKLAGGEITQEDFEAKMQSGIQSLGLDGKVARQLSKLANANNKISTIEFLANEIGILSRQNAALDAQIKICDKQIADQAAAKCDPIGFEMNGVKYDFFIDKDGNGLLSNAQEFLGAENGWDEMAGLDADGNNRVTSDELATLMVVVTQPNGEQIVMPASQLFTNNDFIDLGSYQEAGDNQSLSGTGITTNILGTDAEGNNANILQGTFNVNFNGQEWNTGYQTLDDMNWLSENYNFSDNFFKNNSSFIRQDYQQLINELRTMVLDAMKQLGFSEAAIEEMNQLSQTIGKLEAEKIKLEIAEELKAEENEETEGNSEVEDGGEVTPPPSDGVPNPNDPTDPDNKPKD